MTILGMMWASQARSPPGRACEPREELGFYPERTAKRWERWPQVGMDWRGTSRGTRKTTGPLESQAHGRDDGGKDQGGHLQFEACLSGGAHRPADGKRS
jgi:hypothetical protein